MLQLDKNFKKRRRREKMQKTEKLFDKESERIKRDKERIEKIKAQNRKKRESKTFSGKASRWKTLLLSVLTMATTHLAKAQQESAARDPNTFNVEQSADTVRNPIVKNSDTGLRAAAAELAMDVDFMSNFLIEEGENTLSNFNLSNITITEEVADGIEAGKMSTSLNRYALTTNSGNSDGKHCYRGTKNILNKYGISLTGDHAYEAVDQLRKIPEFTEIKCDYSMLGYLPGGTVVGQGKGTTASGHIFVIGEQNGRKVQRCGRTYQLPTSNRRGSSGQRYGGLYVFVPSDCKLSLDATADLYTKGCFNTPPEEFLLPLLEQDEKMQKMVKGMTAPTITKGTQENEEGKETSYAAPAKSSYNKTQYAQGQPTYSHYQKNRSYGA